MSLTDETGRCNASRNRATDRGAAVTAARMRVELYAAMGHGARASLSERGIQRRHHVGWRTMKAALSSAWPAERAAYPARKAVR